MAILIRVSVSTFIRSVSLLVQFQKKTDTRIAENCICCSHYSTHDRGYFLAGDTKTKYLDKQSTQMIGNGSRPVKISVNFQPHYRPPLISGDATVKHSKDLTRCANDY